MVVIIEYEWIFKYIAMIMFIISLCYKFIPENKIKNIISKFCLDRLYLILYFIVIILALFFNIFLIMYFNFYNL